MVAVDELDKLLEEKFTSTFRKGYVVINGFTFPKRYQELKEEFDNLEVDEEDVWICSFPKSDAKLQIIYVARDPKDTCISYYHHSKLMEGFTGDFGEFCELFLAGKVNFGPYWGHVLPFWEIRNSPNFLFLKYEDMKSNLGKVIKQVSEFLERPLGDEQIEILTKHLSFESMKANPAVNYEMVCDLNKRFKLIEHEGVFMRSGTVGGYKAVMSPEVIERFDEWIKENTQGTDYF
ncbi:Sulfotransfer 1 domain containing protein [Asbolus verrucosus]|uniref:Sulfotransfer 1 domain containing protein n=1 Tax=Asbolus verrucosus TaxID=1661398 RepID=A0A482VEQ4_ASBVE|nr:Sulfotransfer 1 domain containing protein [Asbolus verrucosus]